MTYEDLVALRNEATDDERQELNDQISELLIAGGAMAGAHNGDVYRVEGEELASLNALHGSWMAEEPERLAQRVRDESETRIAAGILVNGAPFRADDASTQRIGDLLTAFEAELVGPEGVSFRTQAGALITLTQTGHVRAIRDALLRHRSAFLAVSAALQVSPPAEPEDDAHWPTPEEVVLT